MSDPIVSAVNHTSGKLGRRLKILRINSEILVALLSNDGSRLQRIDGMPDDARIVGISDHLYLMQDQWAFMVESAEFPEVPDGHHIDSLDLTCRSLYPEAGMTLADLRAFARTETLRELPETCTCEAKWSGDAADHTPGCAWLVSQSVEAKAE